MIATTLGEIATVVSGTLNGASPDTMITGKVEFDSRKVRPGDLFLAIPGERVDGHDFVAQALTAGAVAVLSTRPVATGSVLVADPIEAITALARHNAHRLRAITIGVTGSSGKTSTKDLLAQLLRPSGTTVATPESFNNELGHPYTVLLADESTDFLVLETSARGIGHIAHLVDIAPPRIGLVLNVGSAHLGEFGSVAAIAQAKGELVEELPAAGSGVDGVAVLNADDPLVLAMAARTRARLLTFGEHHNADVRADGVRIAEDGRASFTLVHKEDRQPISLQLYGEHQVSNALAAAAVGFACGLTAAEIATRLNAADAQSKWRMAVSTTHDGITVINDSYNANPESTRAALKALAIMSAGRRSVAVLGHMAELGSESIAEHDAIGRLIVRFDIGKLLAVGDLARPMANGAALEGSWNGESEWVPDVTAAIDRLADYLRPGDVVLVKGSRSAGMDRVAAAVLADHTRSEAPAHEVVADPDDDGVGDRL